MIDIRNIGLMGAVELAPIGPVANRRALDVFERCFEKGVFVRATGSLIALSPPLTMEKKHIDQIVDVLGQAIKESAAHLKE